MSAGINISIQAGVESQNPEVTASGTITHVITDDEVSKFGLNDSQLKDAVNKYFGKKPDDAFLRSPTPWGDLYKTYGWPQVQTVLTVTGSKVVSISSEPVVVATQKFTNNSSVDGTFTVGVSHAVTDTVETNWTNTYGFEVGQTISYGISVLGTGAGGQTSFSFNASFGEGGSHSSSTTMGNNQEASVDLKPGQSVTAQLSASQGTMQVEITYLVSLTGVTAVNYGDRYKDHHFWALDINDVMNAASIGRAYTITEMIEVGFFTNGEIKLLDPVTNKELPILVS